MQHYSYPAPRARPSNAPAGAVVRFEHIERFRFIIPAGTDFVEAARFSGRPDVVRTQTNAGGIEIKLVDRGRDDRAPIRLGTTALEELDMSCERVLARDPAGAGGQVLEITGRWQR